MLRGDDLAPIGQIELDDDADNLRVDAQHSRVLVGYGRGAIAIIKLASRRKAADIRLKADPEGFQIDETGTRVFVNVPGAHQIEVVDLTSEANRSLLTEICDRISQWRSIVTASGPGRLSQPVNIDGGFQ